jgi:hypothetical protein
MIRAACSPRVHRRYPILTTPPRRMNGALDLVAGLRLRRSPQVGFRKPLEKLIKIGFILQIYNYRL